MELQLNLENINISTKKFDSKINNLIDDWAPSKQLSNGTQKLQYNPWITNRILKSIKNKKQYKKMCSTLLSIKKHTHEKKVGHTSKHLKISFWHLLMNLKNK